MYCSTRCYHQSRIGLKRPTQPREPKAPKMIEHACLWCSTHFLSKSSAGARVRFCSRSCQAFYTASLNGTVNTLTDTAAAYIAALVDGEGSISVYDRTDTRPKSIRPSIRVTIAGSYMPMLQWLKTTVGTGAIVQMGRPNNPAIRRTKPCYTWQVGSLHAVYLLVQIERFMIEKRDRALAAIESQRGWDRSPLSTDHIPAPSVA